MGNTEAAVFLLVVLAAWTGPAVAYEDATSRKLLRLDLTTRREKELQEASKLGDLEGVKRLLSKRINPNVVFSDGTTPLMMAAKNNHKRIVEALVTKSIDMEIKNSKGSTALWIAAEAGNSEIIEILVKGGANMETTNNEGVSPIFVATKKGHLVVVKMLLLMGGNPDAVAGIPPVTPLGQSVASGFTGIAKALLSGGAHIHGVPKSKAPLAIAAEKGNISMVELLVSHGADVNGKDSWDGSTPLHSAAEHCHLNVSIWLLEQGAKIAAQNKKGKTPMEVACSSENLRSLDDVVLKERKREVQNLLGGLEKDENAVRSAPSSRRKVGEEPGQGGLVDADTPPSGFTSARLVVRGVDHAPSSARSGVDDRSVVVFVCAGVSIVVFLGVIYIFGFRRYGEAEPRGRLVVQLEKAVQAMSSRLSSGRGPTPKGGASGSKIARGSRGGLLGQLSEEEGRAEMERMQNTPLNFAAEQRCEASPVPPLRLSRVWELKRKKRTAWALDRKKLMVGNAENASKPGRVAELGESGGVDSKHGGLKAGKKSTGQSTNAPRRIAGSTDKVKRAFSPETFDHARVMELKMADFGPLAASFGKGDSQGPVVGNLGIYCDSQGTPRAPKKAASFLKVHIEDFPLPDFLTSDQSDRLFDQASISRRLSLTGSF